jgi:hypothetical protein
MDNASLLVPCLLAAVVMACGHTNASTTPSCGPGRTVLDGVCVSERIAAVAYDNLVLVKLP